MEEMVNGLMEEMVNGLMEEMVNGLILIFQGETLIGEILMILHGEIEQMKMEQKEEEEHLEIVVIQYLYSAEKYMSILKVMELIQMEIFIYMEEVLVYLAKVLEVMQQLTIMEILLYLMLKF